MRVVAGSLGGRIFDSPKSRRTHPMSDKVRGALFGMLGDIVGLTVLDAFAGSGALSIEAISRGAEHAVAVDIDKSAYLVIVENAKKLKIGTQLEAVKKNVAIWSGQNLDKRFDLVLCDPPYDDLNRNILRKLPRHLTESGIFVLSWPGKEKPPEFDNLTVKKTKTYGDIQLIFYQKI
jgi:16S rRNA (guanine966-N2)-methyltransferase